VLAEVPRLCDAHAECVPVERDDEADVVTESEALELEYLESMGLLFVYIKLLFIWLPLEYDNPMIAISLRDWPNSVDVHLEGEGIKWFVVILNQDDVGEVCEQHLIDDRDIRGVPDVSAVEDVDNELALPPLGLEV
jgi:hypothetical protein